MKRILGGGKKQKIKEEEEKYLQNMSFSFFGEKSRKKTNLILWQMIILANKSVLQRFQFRDHYLTFHCVASLESLMFQ